MPNGGIDNCGTCWFNRKNKGEAGHDHADDVGEDFCLLRDFAITGDAFHTYCANSPYNTSVNLDPAEKINVPIGGALKVHDPLADSTRVLWKSAPDSEEIRLKLLELLKQIDEQPLDFGGNMPWDDALIRQLGEIREPRAVNDLKRIAAFDPNRKAPGENGFRTRARTVQLAQEALAKNSKTT